ncbi:hypothetical protein Dsin_026001 [Dipteronia sinensis]|uniref:Uncharacterized protein n=1 Tax=Dipteronia sinensis TaxID=43782 RepID=A0AAD9ZXG4_9ROSI|nr:hypothetical protein Dsin_026001 [Dipteronia sinensis]
MPQNTLFMLLLTIHGMLLNGLLPILPEDSLNRYADFQRVFFSATVLVAILHTKWQSNMDMKRSLRVLILQFLGFSGSSGFSVVDDGER